MGRRLSLLVFLLRTFPLFYFTIPSPLFPHDLLSLPRTAISKLTFASLTRKVAEKLVEFYGGKLTKSLSKNTSLVVVGNDAGPTKLEKIADLNIPTYNEDEFIELLENGK